MPRRSRLGAAILITGIAIGAMASPATAGRPTFTFRVGLGETDAPKARVSGTPVTSSRSSPLVGG